MHHRREGPDVDRLTLDGWTTSLSARQFDAKAIVAQYAGHGTHEQFHSKFRTDLDDLERLPSGKFGTNYLVCQLAALAMNKLRLMGHAGVLGLGAPRGQRVVLGLGANDRLARAFQRLHGELFAACG